MLARLINTNTKCHIFMFKKIPFNIIHFHLAKTFCLAFHYFMCFVHKIGKQFVVALLPIFLLFICSFRFCELNKLRYHLFCNIKHFDDYIHVDPGHGNITHTHTHTHAHTLALGVWRPYHIKKMEIWRKSNLAISKACVFAKIPACSEKSDMNNITIIYIIYGWNVCHCMHIWIIGESGFMPAANVKSHKPTFL